MRVHMHTTPSTSTSQGRPSSGDTQPWYASQSGEMRSVPAKTWFGRQDPTLVHMAAKAHFWIQDGVTQARMTPGHAKKPFYFKKDDFGLPMRTPHPICAHMCSSTLHLDAKIQFFRFFANLPHLGPHSPAPWSVSEKSIFGHLRVAAILPVHTADMKHW